MRRQACSAVLLPTAPPRDRFYCQMKAVHILTPTFFNFSFFLSFSNGKFAYAKININATGTKSNAELTPRYRRNLANNISEGGRVLATLIYK
jgi:hypothetical protein